MLKNHYYFFINKNQKNYLTLSYLLNLLQQSAPIEEHLERDLELFKRLFSNSKKKLRSSFQTNGGGLNYNISLNQLKNGGRLNPEM